jgi:hypothetical protein
LLVPISQIRRTGALIQMVFQAFLISSENLSFLVPAIACLDDAFLGPFFSTSTQRMTSIVATHNNDAGVCCTLNSDTVVGSAGRNLKHSGRPKFDFQKANYEYRF